MPDESDDFLMERDDDSGDEIFSPRKDIPSRHERHSKLRRLKRCSGKMDRSLRPLKQTSYVDHSSMTHSNSSGDDKPETDLRRSTRQRTLRYDTFNTSWITDAQMVRGYPNIKMDFLSDQDSRHSQENDHQTRYNSLRSRSTRKPSRSEMEANRDSATRYNGDGTNKREKKKNMKYIYDFETSEVRTRRVSVRGQTDVQDTPDDSNERTEKEPTKNGTDEEMPRKLNRRTRNKELNDSVEHDHVNGVEEKEKVNGDDSEIKPDDNKKDDRKDQSYDLREKTKGHNETKDADIDSESDQEIRPLRKRRRQPPTLNYMEDPRYSPRKTRNRKITDSEKSSDSSEDEDIRNQRYKYQLRQRKPPKKPDQISLQVPVRRSDRLLHSLCSRSRRDRRRSSTSDDSSSNEEPTRSRKLNKAKHSRHPTSNSSNAEGHLKSGPVGQAPAPIGPETLDTKVRFASVGGLDNHVRCLREMVVLPMMYPEIFRQFQIQPPRGVLFHGPPGTGKTLLARALANECSFGSRKVSFFMRKGADLLSKWVGESEKQLRLLFEQAAQMKPSIIFFDELDGLAPVRSSRQDQIHASIVSTLLALMDGLDNRGEVIVIGATNRIDAIDPALRRPGRFDRELYFPLPARKEREEILRVHVAQWNLPPNEALISHLAEQSAGYCGSDLRALCSEAVIQGLRRTYPQVYTTDYRLQLDPTLVKVEKVDFLRARSLLIPASHRVTQGLGRKLPVVLEPVFKTALDTVINLLKESFPHGLDPSLASVKVSNSMQTAQLLLTGDSHAQGQSIYLAPALLYYMEHVNTYTLDLSTLYKESARSAEEACVEVFNEARRNVPSVIYVPNVEQWWSLVAETVRAIFLSQLSALDPNIPILFLATANCPYVELPEDINLIFSPYRKEVLHLSAPVAAQREAFFRPLIITAAIKPPKTPKIRPKTPPPLPRAPTPPPEPLTETELKKMYDKEEETLRELRIFLRDMCKKLASNKMFYMFTKPVDLEEVPDYLTIIKQPMDLETMMTKVDLHRYSSAQEFLADIDLICMNALEYNPAKTSADKQIRHRACSLRDYAYALIKAEMDSDFEGQCRDISKKRKDRKASVTQFLPPFIHTKPSEVLDDDNDLTKDSTDGDVLNKTNDCAALKTVDSRTNSARISPARKRKVPPWARGYLKSNKRKRANRSVLSESQHQDESYTTQALKSSSGDESKENKPDTKPSVCILSTSTLEIEQSIEHSSEMHTALTANCDIDSQKQKTNTVNSETLTKKPNEISPAIWPSYADLIDDTPHVDDVDLDAFAQSDEQTTVIIDEKELDVVLEKAVNITRGCSILSLMDLYGQLSRVVNIYARTYERKMLPQELLKEITRFQDIQNITTTSNTNMAAS